jgi:putative phosphoribosyl transferase
MTQRERNSDMIESTHLSDDAKHGRLFHITAQEVILSGILNIPEGAHGIVLLTHDIEGVAKQPHEYAIALAQSFYTNGLATLLVDLFASEEQQVDKETGFFRMNTSIMEQRITGIAEWIREQPETANLSIGYFGTGVSGAAALIAAAERPDIVRAVVSAAGRLDMAQEYLSRILAPTMLIVAQNDTATVRRHQDTLGQLTVDKQFEQIPGVSSLFEDTRALNEVARLAGQWFTRWLIPIV